MRFKLAVYVTGKDILELYKLKLVSLQEIIDEKHFQAQVQDFNAAAILKEGEILINEHIQSKIKS